jgi:hypothetical protein
MEWVGKISRTCRDTTLKSKAAAEQECSIPLRLGHMNILEAQGFCFRLMFVVITIGQA